MISKKILKLKLEPIDLKLEQLHSLINIIQNTLENDNSGVFDKDITNLIGVAKEITNSCHQNIAEIDN
ncbi:hypothetical protein RHO12_12575 (plasmid) [Orbus sturtevantii]|uniref:hypothetical protein n=1 Tax=Orbus sturtevantii TaxID=3074109 RepID=UPI00370D7F9B